MQLLRRPASFPFPMGARVALAALVFSPLLVFAQTASTPPPQNPSAAPQEEPGLVVEGNVVSVFQRVNAGGSATGLARGRSNLRGDLFLTLPAGSWGEAKGTASGQLRFGQGNGLALRPTYTSTANTTTFDASAGSSGSDAIVAQAWYRLELPLEGGALGGLPGSNLQFTVGKMDLFAFFDQNAVAADEGAAFMNNAFVHNPLLDSGGDTAADAYGFAPGLRMAYTHVGERMDWGLSAAVFGAGPNADFSRGGGGRPLGIVQFEISPQAAQGEARSTYRLYTWTHGQGTDADGTVRRHGGFGLSVDQRVGQHWNLFGRYGRRTSGEGMFNRALTLGFELAGRVWGRETDAVGFAVGTLTTARTWSAATASTTLAGYAATGSERIAELYYRIQLNDKLAITPDFQVVRRAGGDGAAPVVRVIGVRAAVGF